MSANTCLWILNSDYCNSPSHNFCKEKSRKLFQLQIFNGESNADEKSALFSLYQKLSENVWRIEVSTLLLKDDHEKLFAWKHFRLLPIIEVVTLVSWRVTFSLAIGALFLSIDWLMEILPVVVASGQPSDDFLNNNENFHFLKIRTKRFHFKNNSVEEHL